MLNGKRCSSVRSRLKQSLMNATNKLQVACNKQFTDEAAENYDDDYEL